MRLTKTFKNFTKNSSNDFLNLLFIQNNKKNLCKFNALEYTAHDVI